MKPLLFILTKIFNRTLLVLLRKRQIKEIPEKIRYLIDVRHDSGKDNEFQEILKVVRKNPASMIPYEFLEDFKQMPVDIGFDGNWNLPFATVAQHKIFFPSHFTPEMIRHQVRQSLWEQADASPHRYFHRKNSPPSGKHAVLIGASNCIFALSIIDHFQKLFLFEPDEAWHRAMRKTLANYRPKVEIVTRRAGRVNHGDCVSLDRFFSGRSAEIDFIQADIEGDEMDMLWGAENLIMGAPRLRLSICCYHHAHDEMEIGDFLRARGYSVRPSNGYMLMFMQYPLTYPYLRRGVLYASRRRNHHEDRRYSRK